jgi:RNA polymerase sigma-70 factor (ECF subfamily)
MQAASPPTGDVMSAMDDVALVRAFMAGERAAFDTIVTRHQRAVYQVCYRFVRSHEDAADLAQDVFIRAFKGLKSFKGDSQLTTWLYRVAVNVCLNRTAAKKPVLEPLDPARHQDDRSDDPYRAVVRGERAAEVRRAIAQLPPKQRATLLLRVYQELPHEEIARVLGSSEGAVKTNFFHALGNLKRLLKP